MAEISPFHSTAATSSKPDEFIARDRWLVAPIVFALLTFLMFIDLLGTSNRVVSYPLCDISLQFLKWRDFGFSELRHGNLALWNPHVFCGAPYFGGFQSALLYPLNWLHLLLPVAQAINWIVAIHVFLAGYFTYLWCRNRAIGIAGSILGGVMFMFSGAYFLHLYAGHLPNLSAMIWAPLMLLTIDKLADSGSLKWCALGVFATTMQIFAGHPQYVYYTGIVMTAYALLRTRRWQVPAGLAIMYLGGAAIAAVQLFAGVQAAAECARSAGTGYAFASTFSLPPANFLTWIAPTFFGNVAKSLENPLRLNYWGAGFLWEMSLFVSISGLALAGLGALRAGWSRIWIILTMILVCFALALGRHTFLYRPMFDWAPEYNKFRGTAKFSYLGDLFICLLAAIGFDCLLKQRRVSYWFIGVAASLAIAMLVLGKAIAVSGGAGADGAWGTFVTHTVQAAIAGHEEFLVAGDEFKATTQTVIDSASQAASALYVAGAVALGVVLLLWSSRFGKFIPYGLLILAGIELFCFASAVRSAFDPAKTSELPAPWQAAIANCDRSERILIAGQTQWSGMSVDFDQLTGDDPFVLKRYAEIASVSQGASRADASQYVSFEKFNPTVFQFLRCRLICYRADKPPLVAPMPDVQNQRFREPLPVAMLTSNVTTFSNADELLTYVTGPQFNPTSEAALEAAPPLPIVSGDGPAGSLDILKQETDRLEIQADLRRAAMLLVTNNFSTGWRVRPIDSPQHDFRVVPANYCQIGVPLIAGKHHFILEYSPQAFRIGRSVSIVALLAYASWLILLVRPISRRRLA